MRQLLPVAPGSLTVVASKKASLRRKRLKSATALIVPIPCSLGDAETLLRLLLMHGSGLSLEQTVLRAKQKLALNVLKQVQQRCEQAMWPGGYRYRIIPPFSLDESSRSPWLAPGFVL
jgi:hypothetical protein